MKGIYITEEGKRELEAEIAKLDIIRLGVSSDQNEYYMGRIRELKKILSNATILPVEESYERNRIVITEKKWLFDNYPKGVIIQSQTA